jgi:glycerophosphoryl diester phosphodiesterase
MKLDEFHRLKEKLKRPLIMAHRGASALLPENSPSAFLQAVTDGADVIETDLHFTQDGEIVLIHDDTLERTVEAAGLARDFTLAELKRFKLKQPPERQHEIECIPTLRELIELTEAKVPLALELKDPLFEIPEYGKKLVILLRESGLLGRCAVIGFNKQTVQQVERLAPELVGGWITMTNPWPNQAVEMLGSFWPLLLINPFYTVWAHRQGKIVAPLDPDPDARLGLYLRLGVDVILTDNPAKTLRTLKEKLR